MPARHTLIIFAFLLSLCRTSAQNRLGQPVHIDRAFLQDYSIKYTPIQPGTSLISVCADRNGGIRVFSSSGLLLTHDGQFLYPGTLRTDNRYRTTVTKKIQGLSAHKGQFVLVDDKAVFSNAWAGSLFLPHQLPGARLLAGGAEDEFLISDGSIIHYVTKKGTLYQKAVEGNILDIRHDNARGGFLILTSGSVLRFNHRSLALESMYQGKGLTSFDLSKDKVWLGTQDGYLTVDLRSMAVAGPSENYQLQISDVYVPSALKYGLGRIKAPLPFAPMEGSTTTRASVGCLGRWSRISGKVLTGPRCF